ncbi:hypothetical protein BACUNI_02633 [Bacteroides uniformis ATCC 8492]|uniref:Uncharacterized protein n=1 Tax=Bacteroides uniformis (strain ATCC 8492 / DSM 6597 / CCUG 4942 / CIP 103695 / JCM 5828 / KCTC 5204 / NCTC 13054 / VPI 0061) TaxID=411479 RepID=A0ABC9NB28_BACUC|nr:hypothetical protein BACUNI_02633 [Bacteroides uniformis ATCC 8492]
MSFISSVPIDEGYYIKSARTVIAYLHSRLWKMPTS